MSIRVLSRRRSLRRSVLPFAAGSLLLAATSTGAHAQNLNIDFGAVTGTPASSFGAASGQAGVWNSIVNTGTTSGLLGLNGAATAVSINLAANDDLNGNDSVPGSADINALRGDNFFNDDKQPWSFSLSGLTDGKYAAFFYAPTNQGVSTGTFSVNGTTVSSIQGNEAATLVSGQDWVRVDDIDVIGGALTVSLVSMTSNFSGIAGLQLITPPPPPTAAPEPSSVALAAFGALPLVGIVLRRRAA